MRFLFLSLILFVFTASTQAQPAKPSEGYVPAGQFRVYYREAGAGPVVILLHAGLQNGTMWAAQMAALSAAHRVVVIDLPFHGKTKGVDTVLLAADAVRAVADRLGLQQFSLVGLSMGASVAQDVAIANPGRVQKLVLMASGINGFERHQEIDSVSMAWYSLYSAAMERGDTAAGALQFALAWGEGVHHKGMLTKPAAQAVYRTTLETLRSKPPGWPKLEMNPPAFDRLGQINVPTLIIHGDEDLPYIGEACKYLEKTIPGARRVVLPGAAHMVNLEQPEKVNQLLLQFLQ